MAKSDTFRIAAQPLSGKAGGVRTTRQYAPLPIGRTARIAFELDLLRAGCSRAAQIVVNRKSLDETELEECARLDDALAHAQQLLKATVRRIMLSRIRRKGRSPNPRRRTGP
jgi:hypothetical protein